LYQPEKGVPVDGFKWDSPLTVGVAPLDEQHRSLHQLILALIRTLESGPADAEAEKTFIRIFENAVLHFRTEEDYLEARGYPDLVPHRFEHELLLDWFREQMVLRDGPHAAPLVQLVQEAGTLIQEHQAAVDRAYVVWLETTS
jgi:hemerythrin-like metal-binding protein